MGRTTRTWRRRAAAALGLALLATVPLEGGAGADGDFEAGSGRARANLFEILPRAGGLTIPVSFGKALVTYQGLSATATSVANKPPFDNPFANAADCGGAQPKPPGGGGGGGGGSSGPNTNFPFVSTVAVSTGDKDAEKGRSVDQGRFPDSSPIKVDFEHQEVSANHDPSGRALATHQHFAFGPLVEITGSRAEATAGVVDGKARVAHAVATADRLSLLDGMIVLNDVRWEATQRTGEGEKAEGGFSVGSVLLSGQPLPAPAAPPGLPAPGGGSAPLPDPLVALNTALAPTGIGIESPHFDAAAGVARVTPMSVRFSDSPLGRVALGPLVGALQPLRDPAVDGLLALSCDFATALTVADVAAGVLTGSGGISFDFGGVTATTEGTKYENPFAGGGDVAPAPGDFGALPDDAPLPDLGPAPAAAAGAPYGADSAVLPPAAPFDSGGGLNPTLPSEPIAGSSPAAAPAGDEVALATPAGLFGPTTKHLPGHKGGRALAVAALGILVVLALAAADAAHLRRASRSIP